LWQHWVQVTFSAYPNCLDNRLLKINPPHNQPLHQMQEHLPSHPGDFPMLALQKQEKSAKANSVSLQTDGDKQ